MLLHELHPHRVAAVNEWIAPLGELLGALYEPHPTVEFLSSTHGARRRACQRPASRRSTCTSHPSSRDTLKLVKSSYGVIDAHALCTSSTARQALS